MEIPPTFWMEPPTQKPTDDPESEVRTIKYQKVGVS